ncbi:hypothetical protein IB256_27750 [Pseudomonas sp. PDM17]|uniref:hypothetical protein n=1 Tax=Pseudomonas sp. PDM17 TaxID=2769285 RepID=UPI001781C7EF|nr:hypothetical protein [Pseudomonas sp. PDM17]MBD9504603.1 hypothetical protein [Pseudomonas sp. PDM17]
MAVYLVTWNLNKERSNYDAARRAFIQHLDRYESVKDSGLESVRWVSTNWTANQVSDDLRTKMDGNDRIFVTQVVAGTHQGWLNNQVWEWINARI